MTSENDASPGPDPLAVAESLLADDDIPGLIRHLRTTGDQLPLADAAYAALPVPEEESWAPAREKVRAMLVRAAAARVHDGGLGPQDLRGWHFALTGGLLINISPWGFDAGMNGRWAMVGDSYASC